METTDQGKYLQEDDYISMSEQNQVHLASPDTYIKYAIQMSVHLLHLFHYFPIIVTSWYSQDLLPMTKVMSMQKVKVRGQRSRSQRSRPNLAISGLKLQFEFTYCDEMMQKA